MRFRGTVPSGLALLLLLRPGASLDGQVVRGTVTSADDGGPVNGAFVRVLDESGRQVAGVLTNASGAYRLTVPGPGSYRLRVEFIGRESVEIEPVVLQEGGLLEWSTVLPARPIRLRGLEVRGDRRCSVRPSEGTLAARLWEEARKVLEVALWAEQQSLFRYELNVHRRELDADRERIVEETIEPMEGYFRRPFTSKSASSLLTSGFVQETPDGRFTYAPDAGVLLADEFLDTHCFRAVRDDERVGLAFEPTRDRRVTDIRGVMWLDPESAWLDSVTYTYVRFPGVGPELELGGRVGFARLPNGAWIVRDWMVEMPVVADVRRPGSPDVRDRRIVGVMQEGGEVLIAVDRRGRTVLAADRATLAGTVLDSVRGRPLAGAEVRLTGTSHRAVSEADGSFLLTDLPGGPYTVHFSHPRLDSLGVEISPSAADLEIGETTWLELGLPTAFSTDRPLIRGEVLDADGDEPVPGAMVSLVEPGEGELGRQMTDAWGAYAFNVPASGWYTVRVEAVGREGVVSDSLRVERSSARLHSLRFDRARVRLDEAALSAPAPCLVRPPAGSATGRAWEEVRKALATLTWARDAELFEYRVVLRERERILGDPVMARDQPLDRLVQHRFPAVGIDDDGRPRFVERYMSPAAPDEEPDSGVVVTTPGPEFVGSTFFADRYCVGLVPSPAGPETIALRFAPDPPDTTVADVRGLIVIDRETSALRSLQYRYERFPGPPSRPVPGGWMTFGRLPGGDFFVEEWERRLPRIAWLRHVEVSFEPPTPDMRAATRARSDSVHPEVASDIVQGGHVTEARAVSGELLWRAGRGAVSRERRARMWAIGSVLDEPTAPRR